jgi:hypothetical protein
VTLVLPQGGVPLSYYKPVDVDDAGAEALLEQAKSGLLAIPDDWPPLAHLLHHRSGIWALH